MKKAYIGLILLLLTISIIVFLFIAKSQKDKWTKEPPETKYSEKREKEVWGGVLRGNNPCLYYGTPLYNLANEMSSFTYFRNYKKIEKLIDKVPENYINFQEEKYGMTIGQFALKTNNMAGIRKLLDRKLNPNLMDKSGNAIIIDINDPFMEELPEYFLTFRYLIKKGANVNLYSEKRRMTTPLIEATKWGLLENVKELVKAGANPHFTDRYSNSALSYALQFGKIKVVNYLIFDQKVDYKTLKYPTTSKFHPGEYKILHELRGEMLFKLNSKEYQEKMKLVAYLKTQGLDYWKTPIPDKVKNIPNYTQDYLSKY